MTYIPLHFSDLAIAALLIFINAGLSLALGLGIERRLFVAAARMVVQLLLVGVVLEALFRTVSPWATALVAAVMIGFAGREATARQDRRLAGWWSLGLGTGAMLMAAGIVTLFALTTQVRPHPWYDPRYAIPLLGMVLGNTMNGISLGLNTLSGDLAQNKAAVEARLALGVERWPAMRPLAAKSLRAAMIPIVNSMAATGLVSLPGMMTGQILGGVAPFQAVKYQILVMFLIAGGTGIGAVAAVGGGVLRLTDNRHRIRLDRLE